MEIILINEQHYNSAFNVLVQLRSNLDFNEFKRRMYLQELLGYRLYGMLEKDQVLGLVGFRIVHSFARGLYIEIDDLVVDEKKRKQHIGEALIDFVADYAKERNANFLFLNARIPAIPFYEKLNFVMHGSPAMKFELKH
jgi:GNAT superfamily N-acetyltransferase